MLFDEAEPFLFLCRIVQLDSRVEPHGRRLHTAIGAYV
jgi:hypothetical protein